MADLAAAEVQRQLDLPAKTMAWLEHIERPTADCAPVLPDDAEAARLLERLGVQPADRAATLAARPDLEAHPALWWVLDRAYHDLLANMGAAAPTSSYLGWPGLPATAGALGRHLYVWVFLATLPHVRRYHAERGVPDQISWANLAALGSAMASARLESGMGGLDAQWSLPLIFRGAQYRLGRLAFDRRQPQPASSDHPLLQPGQSDLNTHIPSDGSLHPAACDQAFAQARAFFFRHFPERPVAFTCHSWLLDDQLTAYLPETSNIIQFQRRFRLLPQGEPEIRSDWAIMLFVFHRRYDGLNVPTTLLDELPQQTTLQRAIVAHLRAGGHWHSRTGWFPF
jgi:hypothetical protein